MKTTALFLQDFNSSENSSTISQQDNQLDSNISSSDALEEPNEPRKKGTTLS